MIKGIVFWITEYTRCTVIIRTPSLTKLFMNIAEIMLRRIHQKETATTVKLRLLLEQVTSAPGLY